MTVLFIACVFTVAVQAIQAEYSVSHVVVFVSNLDNSEKFYIELLGGQKSDELSSDGWLEKDYVDSIPVLSMDDEMKLTVEQVRWSFVVFDNMMIQLVQIQHDSTVKADNSRQSSKKDQMLKMMKGKKIAFWVIDDLNITEYMTHLETRAEELQVEGFKLQRPFLLSDTAVKRRANPGVTDLRDDKLTGLSVIFGSGPDGEMIKFIQLFGNSRHAFGRHYCDHHVVSSAYLNKNLMKHCDTACNCSDTPAHRLHGVNHISLSVSNISLSVKDLTSLLSAEFIEDIQPTHLQSESLTKALSCEMPPPPSNGGSPMNAEKMKAMLSQVQLNFRYFMLKNVKLELSYLTLGDNVSPMMLDMISSFLSMIKSPTLSSIKPGNIEVIYSEVHNTTEQETTTSESVITEGPLAGISYDKLVGNSELPFYTVIWNGDVLRKHHLTLRKFKVISPLYPDINPWSYYGYEEYCMNNENFNEI